MSVWVLGANSGSKSSTEIKKPTAASEELRAKLGVGSKTGCWSKSRVLPLPAAHTTTGGAGTRLSQPSSPPLDTLQPSYLMRNNLDFPISLPNPSPPKPPAGGASQQGSLLFVLTLPCRSKGPSKALPEFLVWPLINFYREP